MNLFNRLILISLGVLLSMSAIADVNYSLRDSSHPWFPLTRAKWKMEGIQYPTKPKQKTLKNGFVSQKVNVLIKRGRIGFGLGCNGHGAKLILSKNNQLLSEEMISTQMGCKKQLQDADKEISTLLSQVISFSSNKSTTHPTLLLQSQNGTRLYFRGEPIPEVKYGESKIRRLELKHHKKENCTKKGCLEWREVFVDKKGVITHKTAWANNPLKIRDFKSSPNRWYGLRVKEFKSSKGLLWYLESNGSSANLDYVGKNF